MRSPADSAERRRRSRGNCGATRRPVAGTALRCSSARGCASRPSPSTPCRCQRSAAAAWSPSCSVGGGAHSRLVGTCVCASPTTGRCGYAMRASMRLSTKRIRVSYDHHGWRRTAAHRCALVEITAARTSDSSADEAAFNSRCSPSTTARSRQSIDQSQGTGNLNGVVKPPERVSAASRCRCVRRGVEPTGRRYGGEPGR